MKKIYQRIMMVVISMMMATNMMAETTAYAITSNVNSKNCYIFSFDINDPSKIVETIWEDTIADEGALMATLADSIYYVYTSNNQFCSINMTTGVKTVLNNASASSEEYWYDICYDPVTEKLYGLRKINIYEEVDGENELVASEYQLCTINPSTGVWKEYVVLPSEIVDQSKASYYLGGICSDGKGGICVLGANQWFKGTGMQPWWNSYINLYCVNLTTKETTTLFESSESTVVNISYSNITGAGTKISMEMHDGIIYYMGNNNLLTIDPATGATTLNAKKASKEPVGLCFAKSTADGTPAPQDFEPLPEDKSIVKVVETYGDHMGERGGQMTHKRISLYDGENRLQREATYGLSYTNEWEIEYFKTYTYNEAGQLAASYSQKYGVHDGTDLAFIDNRDTVTYDYDEAGNMVKTSMQAEGYNMLYEYDEEGRVVKECKQMPDYYDQYEGDFYNMWEITYSAFNAFGQPDSIHSTGLYDTDKYFGVYTYDEQGRKTSARTWTLADTTNVKMETWTYYAEGDTAMVYWVHEWFYGFDNGERRTVYTYDNGNVNRTKEQIQTLVNGEWVNEITYTITELSEMNPDAVAKLSVADGKSVNQVLEPNSAVLTITLPESAITGTLALDVYRHGIKLARLNATDAVDGKLTYIDEGVKNGTVDYYVQTVLINELLETEDALNISNVETYTHYVELPVVTEIKCTSARMEGGVYYATIEWTAPTDTTGLAFQRYNVMLDQMKAADNGETDGQALSWEVNCGYTGKVNLYIQTVYKYGKANSEMVGIDCQAVIDAQGIEATGAEAQVTVKNGVVFAAAARLSAYNAQGALVAETVNVLDLNTQPAGVYLVKVETAESVKTVKVRN